MLGLSMRARTLSLALLLALVGAAPASAQQLSVSDAQVVVGSGDLTPATFTVSLGSPSSARVDVTASTVDGTAGASDFDAMTIALSFAPGETIKTVNVDVLGDTADEPDESFGVVLSNASAPVADGSGTGVIVDDDAAPPPPAQAPAPASFAPPAVGTTLRLAGSSLRLRRSRVVLSMTCAPRASACRGTATLRAATGRRARLDAARLRAGRGTRVTATFVLSRRAQRDLRRRRRMTVLVTVTGRDASGARLTVGRRMTLRSS
jgi:hypothetical protein